MISIEIEDIKDFMSRLLIKNDFDNFYLNEMEIVTSHKITINGKINKEWFRDINVSNEDDALDITEDYMRWKDIKSYAYDCIKGNKTPQYIKMILSFSKGNMERIVEKLEVTNLINDIGALYLNIKFDSGVLILTTAVSYKNFTMDKTVERQWDNYIEKVFG